jgi:hypothetical protein
MIEEEDPINWSLGGALVTPELVVSLAGQP